MPVSCAIFIPLITIGSAIFGFNLNKDVKKQTITTYTVNIYMYKTIEANANTVASPTTRKSLAYTGNCLSLYG